MDDFQRLFARYRLILAVALGVGAVVALVLALARSTTYAATAAVNVQDINQIEASLGQTNASTQLPSQLASVTQQLVTSDAVLRQTMRLLPAEGTVTHLRDNVSATVDPVSDLILVTANAPTARRSVTLANTIATLTAAETNLQTRSTFAADASNLARQIAALPNTAGSSVIRRDDEANLSRLQTLAVIGSPAKVQQPANVPTAATSKRIPFYVVLGALLGLILGIGIAFVKESLDRTVHAPGDVADNLHLPIVGHVDADALGAAPFLARDASTANRNAIARFGILRRSVELMSGESGRQKVLVTSPGPEEGKTTVALSLACAFAGAGRRTILVEADLRRPTLAGRLGLTAEHGLGDYLANGTGLDDVVQTVKLPTGSLECVPAGTLAGGDGAADALASPRFGAAIEALAGRCDVLVIDGPPLIPVADALEIVPMVESYLVCLRAGQTRIAQLSAARELLQRLPERPGGAVITDVAKGRYALGGSDGYYRETD